MRRSISFLFVALLSLFFLGGCLPEFFTHPPTGPTRSDNTWLLGVWEMPKIAGEDGPDAPGAGGAYRAVLSPISSDRMVLTLEDLDKNGRILRQLQGHAWISRVGDASLLVAEIQPDGSPQTSHLDGPKYLVVGYQLLDPVTVRLRELSLPPEATQATRFNLRIFIRQAFRAGTLFSAREQVWTKTGEIYWQPGGNPATDTFSPPRNLPASPPTAPVSSPAPAS